MTPIRPKNKGLYPANWPEIRAKVQARAGDKCEKCGVANHAEGYRDQFGAFHKWNWTKGDIPDGALTIVCTTAHLDHNPTNNDLDNLRFWCQQCHNRYDAPERAAGIKRRRRKARTEAGQESLDIPEGGKS